MADEQPPDFDLTNPIPTDYDDLTRMLGFEERPYIPVSRKQYDRVLTNPTYTLACIALGLLSLYFLVQFIKFFLKGLAETFQNTLLH